MKKLINWLSFLGAAMENVAESFKKLIPKWDDLQKANKSNVIAGEGEAK